MQHLETCLLTDEADRVFLPSCNGFNCLFPLDVQNEIQLLPRILGFWLGNAPLVGNPIPESIVSFKTELHFTFLDA